MIRIIVDSQLRLPLAKLSDELLSELCSAFTHSNPKHHKLKRINRRAARGEPETIATYDMTEHELLVPRGGSQRLRQVLRDNAVRFCFDDRRSEGDPELVTNGFPEHLPGGKEHPDWKLWDHQQQAVEAVLRRENCLIRAPCGSGKTTAAIAAIAAIGLPALVIARSVPLLQQWCRRVASELPGTIPGIIRGKKRFELSAISIAMQQTLWNLSEDKWREIDRAFGVVVCDEVHQFAARTCRDAVRRIPARYRIGVSADESRSDGCEFLIYDEFGDVELEISQKRLIELGVVLDVEVRMIPTEFRADWYVKQREAMAEALKRGRSEIPPDYKRLLDRMVEDDARSEVVMPIARKAIDSGEKVMMISRRVAHCKRLRSMAIGYRLKAGLHIGEVGYEKEREETADQFRAGELQLMIGVNDTLGYGVDLPAVSVGFVMTPMSKDNRQQWGQLRGRLCRTAKGKRGAVIYYLWDRHVFGVKPLEAMRSWNRKVKVLWDGKWIGAKEALKRYEAK